MRKPAERARARELRKLGWPLRRIAAEVGVSLSTVSLWTRDLPAPERRPRRRARAVHKEQPTPPQPTELRACRRCLRILLDTDFNRYRGGRQWWCRDCFREYFRDRGQLHLDQVKQARRDRVRAARETVDAHLATNPCVDCGNADPRVLEFDHVGPKRGNVNTLAWGGLSTSALLREIAECEVVCVNCHRRRTARRAGAWRANPVFGDEVESFHAGRRRNQEFVFNLLSSSSCFDCGLADVAVLEFDHLAGKEHEISKLVGGGYRLELLRSEIAKCSIRCANCHRIQTRLRQKVSTPGGN
jgi:hypothetical protein